MWEPLSTAYRFLFNAYLKVGPITLESIALTTPSQVEVSADVKPIVDIQVPTLKISEKKSILITGCSSGIGLCASLGLKTRGYRVFASARKPEDVKAICYDVLRHRLMMSYEGQAEGIKSEEIILEILKKVPVP